jgi:hypothetical protein
MSHFAPFFKYAGSKMTLSKSYYPRPRHQHIVEPFAGSACYATTYANHSVTLIEKDYDIASLWRYLISTPGQEIAKLPTTELRRGEDIRRLPLDYGAKVLIRCCQRVGRNDCWTVSKWCNTNSGLWGERKRDVIASQVEYIRHWKILEWNVQAHFDALLAWPDATWFIDPPYISLPLYDSKSINYPHLGEWCQRLKGQVIVCEAYGADWLPFRRFKKMRTGRAGQGCSESEGVEAIWTNETPELS